MENETGAPPVPHILLREALQEQFPEPGGLGSAGLLLFLEGWDAACGTRWGRRLRARLEELFKKSGGPLLSDSRLPEALAEFEHVLRREEEEDVRGEDDVLEDHVIAATEDFTSWLVTTQKNWETNPALRGPADDELRELAVLRSVRFSVARDIMERLQLLRSV